MKKIYLLLSFGLLVILGAHAQTPQYYNGTGGTSNNSFPLNTATSDKVQWIYAPSALWSGGTGVGSPAYQGLITTIYFHIGSTLNTSFNYTNFKISLGQNLGSISSYPASGTVPFNTGLTQCFYMANYNLATAVTNSWYSVTLQTPFLYDPSLALIFEMTVDNPSVSGATVLQMNNAGLFQRIYGNYLSTTGTSNTGLVDFGIDLIPNANLNFGTPTLMSVNESSSTYSIPVIISNGTSGDMVDVNLDAASTATLGTDFTFTPQTLTFTAANDTQYATLSILDDCVCELTENIILNLDNPVGTSVISADSVFTVDILPNDTLPNAFFNPNSYLTSESSGSQNITINLAQAYCDSVTVLLSINAATSFAVNTDWDFPTPGTTYSVVIPANQTSFTLPITIYNNLVYNFGVPQNIVLDLTVLNNCLPVGAGTGGPTTCTINVADDDQLPAISFAAPSAITVNESAGTATLRVDLSAPYTDTVTFNIAISPISTAQNLLDYIYPSPQVLTILPGADSVLITFPIVNDLISEPTEVIFFSITTNTNCTLGTQGSAQVTILDDDISPQVTFQLPGAGFNENAGTVQIAVDLSQPNANPTSVDVTLIGGTATPGTDFTGSTTQTVTFPGNSTATQYVTFNIANDLIIEPNETFDLFLTNMTNSAMLGTNATFIGTIIDNDSPGSLPIVQFANGSNTVSESVGNSNLGITITNPNTSPVVFNYTVSGTATNGSDFTITSPSPITVGAGLTSATLPVTIINDIINENPENIIITLTQNTNCTIGNFNSHIININDDDVIPTVQFGSGSGTYLENAGTVNLNLTVNNPNTQPVVFTYTIASGATATPTTDYTIGSSPVTAASGLSTVAIPLTIIDDAIAEPNEYFTINIAAQTNCTIGGNNYFNVYIVDNDMVNGINSLTQNQIRVSPNPIASGEPVYFENLPDGNLTFQLVNVLGQKVAESQILNNQAELNSISSGMVFYKIVDKDTYHTLKEGKLLIR